MPWGLIHGWSHFRNKCLIVSLFDLASSVICPSFLHLFFLFSQNCIDPASGTQYGLKTMWQHHPCQRAHVANIPSQTLFSFVSHPPHNYPMTALDQAKPRPFKLLPQPLGLQPASVCLHRHTFRTELHKTLLGVV